MKNEPIAVPLRPERASAMDVQRTPVKRRRRTLVRASLAALALACITFALSRLKAAAPSVDRATVFIDTVKRGQMLRQVLGPGTLQPEQIRWVSAVVAARVERIPVRPGARVEPDTILLELINPDLELAALEAERQLASASAELVNLEATQRNGRLAQESSIASLSSGLNEARRRAAADQELAQKGFLSELEMAQTKGRADELGGRLAFEEKRLVALGDGMAAQRSAQNAQAERLRAIAQFRRREVDALKVRAGVSGVLQELPLQVGQWLAPGTLLAKVAQPERLKAEIRIAEVQARDIQIGQPASIDTRNGVVPGHVVRIDPAVHGGTVKVDVALEGSLPKGARPDLSVEGTIELERLKDVVFVGRPAFGQGESTIGIFKIAPDGEHAVRVQAQLGRSSVKTVEIKDGLAPGDRVILSDTSQWDSTERIRLQ